MINLFSPQARRTLFREYWLRVVTVWAIMISGLCLTLVLLILPTYVLIHSQLNVLAIENQKNVAVEDTFKTVKASIVESNVLVEKFSQPLSRVAISTIIDGVSEAKTAGIEIATLSLARETGIVHKVQVQGEARSRADLIQFKSALERSPLFENVLIPLSDLARDTNLTFSLSLSLTPLTQ